MSIIEQVSKRAILKNPFFFLKIFCMYSLETRTNHSFLYNFSPFPPLPFPYSLL